MINSSQLKYLIKCKSFNEWFKYAKEIMPPNEISQLWNRFKWGNVNPEDKELIQKLNEENNSEK